MARLGRYFLPEQPLHVIQRGNNRQTIFLSDDDREIFLGWLLATTRDHGCRVHAYVLMTNHIHLLLTPERADSLPRTMQSIGRRYVRYVNDMHGRTGTLWEGRYRAAPIHSEPYLMACYRYIELNPVRAKMVRHPRDHRWSSYRANAQGVVDPIVSPHPLYRSLGRSARERQESYRALFRERLPDDFVDALRNATNGGWALGDEEFKRRISKGAKRRAEPLPKGRRAMKQSDKRQLNLL
jgi:REP-associated tyrosine transposase